jgi:hypothetical protein
MTYLEKLHELESDLHRILEQEYKNYVLHENMKVSELLGNIRCRMGNSFCVEHLYNCEIKERK